MFVDVWKFGAIERYLCEWFTLLQVVTPKRREEVLLGVAAWDAHSGNDR